MQKLKSIHKGIHSDSVETYDNVTNGDEQKEKEITYDLQEKERDAGGFTKKTFTDIDSALKKIKKRNIKNEAKILDVDYDSTIPEESKIDEKDYENKTFRLVEESSLFSQLSENRLQPQNIDLYEDENPCQMVEVKAGEIIRSVVTAVESLVVPGPDDAEMVQIIDDTDTEPESSSPAITRRLLKNKEDGESGSEESITKELPLKSEDSVVKPKRSNLDVIDKDTRLPSKLPKNKDTDSLYFSSAKELKQNDQKELASKSKPGVLEKNNLSSSAEELSPNQKLAPTNKREESKVSGESLKQDAVLEKFPKPFNYEKAKVKRKIQETASKREKQMSKGSEESNMPDVSGSESSSSVEALKKDKQKIKAKSDTSDADYDSFYGSDKDNDEELVFSEDDTTAIDIYGTESTISDDDRSCYEQVS